MSRRRYVFSERLRGLKGKFRQRGRMKRLASLDAMRGFAILAMIPFHVLLFGAALLGLLGEVSDGAESSLPELFVVELNPPLATGLLIFFFVTGMSLAVSLGQRIKTQRLRTMAGRVVFRYGGYVLVAVLSEWIMWYLLTKAGAMSNDDAFSISNILLGAGISAPIIGIAYGAIIFFPVILKLSWKKLVGTSVASGLVVSAVLYWVMLPHASSMSSEPSLLSLLLTGSFALLKGLPVILFGGAVGKLILERRHDLKRLFALIGGAISGAYIVIPTVLGTGMLHMLLAVWAYHHGFIFIVGACLLLFSLILVLKERPRILSLLAVMGRLSIITYFGHFLIDAAIILLVGVENFTLGMMFSMMIVVTIIIWIALYVYGRWRWGPIPVWYE